MAANRIDREWDLFIDLSVMHLRILRYYERLSAYDSAFAQALTISLPIQLAIICFWPKS